MPARTLAFASGIALLHSFARLPGAVELLLLGLVAAVLWHRRGLRPLCLFALGLIFAAVHAQWALDHRLPRELEGRDLPVRGRLVGLPERQPGYTQVLLAPQVLGDLPAGRLPRLIKLGWYGEAPTLLPGDEWALTVRLKRPHGLRNPGGFDYERHLFARGIDATGYVRDKAGTRLLSRRWTLDRLRLHIADRVAAQLPEGPGRAMVLALVVGDTRQISTVQWEWLRITGTSHLIAISGLHVGLIASLVYLAGLFAWRRLPGLCLRLPAPVAATLLAVLAAIAYAALAGFSLPTQRALIMLAVPGLLLLSRRRVRPWRAWGAALLAVLLWDPLAPLSPGFWLSFFAVAALLAVSAVRRREGWLGRYLRPQLTLSLALLPLTAFWFQQGAWLGPPANLVAIPLVGVGLVPLALLGTGFLFVWEGAGALLLALAGQLAAGLCWALAVLAEWDGGHSALPALPLWALAAAALSTAVALLPRGALSPWLLLPLLLPIALHRPAAAGGAGRAVVTVLDVGQGQAVVVEVGRRVLVYDTGPAFGALDAGATVLVPFLRHRGVRKVDLLVVSHGDRDHSGGTAALLSMLPVREILSGDPLTETPRERPCRAGQRWQWDGVTVEVLWPRSHGVLRRNNGSCVLRIEAGGSALLLTGDIEAVAEHALVQQAAERLPAQVMLMPHHGSRSSSSPAFVTAVQPRLAIASAGYRNRFGFPRPEVVQRYRSGGAEVQASYVTGALRFELGPTGVSAPVRYRARQARYYHDRPEL